MKRGVSALAPVAGGALVALGGVLSSEERVLQAQVFARHGARTPLSSIDSLPLPDSAFSVKPLPVCGSPSADTRHMHTLEPLAPISPYDTAKADGDSTSGMGVLGLPPGILTQRGLEDLHACGQDLRKRYVGTLLPEAWDSAEGSIYLRSTNFERTVQSATTRVGAMYPGSFAGGADASLVCHPLAPSSSSSSSSSTTPSLVRVHTSSPDRETLYPCRRSCPKLKQLSLVGRNRLKSGGDTGPGFTGSPSSPLGDTGYTLATLTTAVAGALGLELAGKAAADASGSAGDAVDSFDGTAPLASLPFSFVALHDVIKALEHDRSPLPPSLTGEQGEKLIQAISLASVREAVANIEGSGLEEDLETGLRLASSRAVQELALRLDQAAFTHALQSHEEGSSLDLPDWITPTTVAQLSQALEQQRFFPVPPPPPSSSSSSTSPTPSPPKFILYSAHDTSLIPLLASLNIWDGSWPGYGATLGFELVAVKEEEEGGGGGGAAAPVPPPVPTLPPPSGEDATPTPPPSTPGEEDVGKNPAFDAATTARLEALIERYIASVEKLAALGEYEDVSQTPEAMALVAERTGVLGEITQVMNEVFGVEGGVEVAAAAAAAAADVAAADAVVPVPEAASACCGGAGAGAGAGAGESDAAPTAEDFLSLGKAIAEAAVAALGSPSSPSSDSSSAPPSTTTTTFIVPSPELVAAVEDSVANAATATSAAVLSALEASAARASAVESGAALERATGALEVAKVAASEASASAAAAQTAAAHASDAASSLAEHAGLVSHVAEARGHALAAVKAAAEAAVLAQAETAVLLAELEGFRAKAGAEAASASRVGEEVKRRVLVEREELEASLAAARTSATSLLELARTGVEEGLKSLAAKEREARGALEESLKELNAELGEAVAWAEGRRAAALGAVREAEGKAEAATLAAAVAVAVGEREAAFAKERVALEMRAALGEAAAAQARAVEETRAAMEEAVMTKSLAGAVIEAARGEVSAAQASAAAAAVEARERVEAEVAAAEAAVEAVRALAKVQLEEAERESQVISARLVQLKRIRETALDVAAWRASVGGNSSAPAAAAAAAATNSNAGLWEDAATAAKALVVGAVASPPTTPSSTPASSFSSSTTPKSRKPSPPKSYQEVEAGIVVALEEDRAAQAAALEAKRRAEVTPAILSAWGVKDTVASRAQVARYMDTFGLEGALSRAEAGGAGHAAAAAKAVNAGGASGSSGQGDGGEGETYLSGLVAALYRNAKPVERAAAPPPAPPAPAVPAPINDSYTAHLKVEAIRQGLPIPSDVDGDEVARQAGEVAAAAAAASAAAKAAAASHPALSPGEEAYSTTVASGTVASQPYTPWGVDHRKEGLSSSSSSTPTTTTTTTVKATAEEGESGYLSSLTSFATRTAASLVAAAAAAAAKISSTPTTTPVASEEVVAANSSSSSTPPLFPSQALRTPEETKALKASLTHSSASPDEAYLSAGVKLLPPKPSTYGLPTSSQAAPTSEEAYTQALLGKKSGGGGGGGGPSSSTLAYSPASTPSPSYSYYVRTLYNGVPVSVAPGLGGNTLLVPLPIFRLILARRISRDYLEECGSEGRERWVNTVAWPSQEVMPALTPDLAQKIGVKSMQAIPHTSILSLAVPSSKSA